MDKYQQQKLDWLTINSTKRELLEWVDSYQRVTGISDTKLAHRAVGDAYLITRLRKGGSCTIDKLDLMHWYLLHTLTPDQWKLWKQLMGIEVENGKIKKRNKGEGQQQEANRTTSG